MITRSDGLALAITGILFVACSSGSTSGSSSTLGSGGVTPSCYMASDRTSCTCLAANDDANRSAALWTKVSGCDSTILGGRMSCYVDTNVDGETTSCLCYRLRCEESGSQCRCGGYLVSGTSTMTTCTGYEWCCATDNGSDCYCGNGAFGAGCANAEHTVSSCGLSSLEIASDHQSSCAGLTFAAPAPSGPGGGSGDGECSSSSECSSKCSTRCYDCRSKSCVCGRIGLSGSCIY